MRYVKFVLALGLVILLAACGSNKPQTSTPPAASAAPASTSAAAPPDLNAELLGVSDLPTGWSSESVGDSTQGAPQCIINARADVKGTSMAEAAFAYGSNSIPTFDELLNYLPGKGQNGMTAVSQVLSGCGQISTTTGGQTLTGTISPLSYPAVADQSSAYQMNLTGTVSGQSVTLGIDLVVFRKGDTVAMLLYADLGTPNVSALQQIVQDAIAKLS